MIRNDRSVRNQLGVSLGLTLTGIASAVYGIESIGGLAALCGIVLLGLSIHRLGRVGEDI